MEYLSEKRWVPALKALPDTLDADKRTLKATITDNSVDRDGEVVDPSAFGERIDTFLQNPVLLWMHNPMNPPIGKIPSLEFHDDRVEADIQFRDAGDDPLADNIFSLYKQGILTSFSIGFRVFDMTEGKSDEDTGEVEPPRVTDAELFEVSAVTIPANVNAVAKMMDQAAVLDEAMASFGKQVGIRKPPRVVKSNSPTIYTGTSVLDTLSRARDYVAERVDRLVKGNPVQPDELQAINALRICLLNHPAVKSGSSSPLAGDVVSALADLNSHLGQVSFEVESPGNGQG